MDALPNNCLQHDPSMNFFAQASAAERYSRYRPYFHPVVIERIHAYLSLKTQVAQALDVGCGTGQSTWALKRLAKSIVGVDISASMLAQAQASPQIRYLTAPAEAIPLPNESCDLITSSLAFHWFERERFLAETQRLLKPRGWLIIYNNGFLGQMVENPAFTHWHNEVYLPRYPSPPRNAQPLTADQASSFGLDFPHQELYQNQVTFSVEEVAAYLTTQSNVIHAVEQGAERLQAVYAWLVETISPLFAAQSARFAFGGYIWYLCNSRYAAPARSAKAESG